MDTKTQKLYGKRDDQFKTEEWLMEEYKVQSKHYFHEDNQIQKTLSIYATLNSGLIAFISSEFVLNKLIAFKIIPIIGIILCISWISSLVRIRECRNYIEFRIQQIEQNLHKYWKNEEFIPLDLRTFRNWANCGPKKRWYNFIYRFFRNSPSSLTFLIIPLIFLIVWSILLIFPL